MELEITVKQAVPLAILYEVGNHTVEGKTRMQKLVFLTQKELEDLGVDLYEFIKYDHGPFQKAVLQDLEMFQRKGLVEIERVPTFSMNHRFDYSLTDDGVDVFEGLIEENDTAEQITETAADVIEEYNNLSIRALMDYVYDTYPQYKENSVHY